MSDWVHQALEKYRREAVELARPADEVEFAVELLSDGPTRDDARRGVAVLRGLARAVDGYSIKGLRDIASGAGHPVAPVILNKIIDAIEKAFGGE